MARILITGSSDGIGSLCARVFVKDGHKVVLHARSEQRAKDATNLCPGAETVVVADLSNIAEMKRMAEEVNKLGDFDVVIHNAGLYRGPFQRTEDGYPSQFAVNTVAPFILTCLIKRPKRLIYLTSIFHQSCDPSLNDITWKNRGEEQWNDNQGYHDTKFHTVLLANAVARRWPHVLSNALDPGWVPTKMGGSNATGDINDTVKTYELLAVGDVHTTGKYFCDSKEANPIEPALDTKLQDRFIDIMEDITGIKLPEENLPSGTSTSTR
ncbi:NAD(P)-binding protein [Eremomyces bilateralis CBS 781.70]|uniref:NAD(P)-binding protein n=1 Tax=Eremomyces bilateralis CBS 781.70 TaxID=1392243 RepID=A0A6G1FSE4_9PEZI|nr:NAD(P)-binding protein [Eremomyces bilateralis CBS 781.70]KAF1808656.1 NAD(P)-binding protein [Eremomyces bilateralis CBS 781.70]